MGGSTSVSSAELLLHPIRLRIVQAFLGNRQLTTTDLRGELDDVPPATLYRQVAALREGGLLEVAEERRVRGTVERTFRLRTQAASVEAADAAGMSLEEHRRAFLTFVAGVLADYDRYLARGDVDLGRDRVGYRQAAMYLNAEETDELVRELRAVIAARAGHPPGGDRTRRLFSSVLMPAPEGSDREVRSRGDDADGDPDRHHQGGIHGESHRA